MRVSLSIAAALAGTAVAAPAPKIPFVASSDVIPVSNTAAVVARQSKACFVIGSTTLPKETADIADDLASTVTCSNTAKTLSNVPDVTSGSTTFSSIDFSQSNQTPLQFSLSQFATANPLASTDLATFQDMLNVYQATEAGIRSVGGSLAIKVPKFFLEMQVSRIQTAQGNPPTAAGLQVDHLRDKVLKNAPREAQALLNQVTQLATQLS
ncbi:hypothetical protein F5Y04DRAFT_51311 [Hypomontagnella monticulosa]|nr:hypothetical protein F5Y04DRAFT_51311 [Hypomontagnella monticulosa]